jgi:hypothetical protein
MGWRCSDRRWQRDGRITFASPGARPGPRPQLTDARVSTLLVVLSLYVLSHRPSALPPWAGSAPAVLPVAAPPAAVPPPDLPSLPPCTRTGCRPRLKDHQYEEGSEPSPHASPSLRWVVFDGFSLRVREVIRIHHSSLLATVDDQQPVLQGCRVDLGFLVGYAVVLADLLAWGFRHELVSVQYPSLS